MQDYLVFQLYAPLVAWGDQAVGQERPSADHPSRSALLGLLAAALGIDRADEQQHAQLSAACHFGIKLYTPGLALRDFHTAQVPPADKKAKHRYTRRDELREAKLGTILSFRSYRQDSLSVVALWLGEGSAYSLTQLQNALREPRFHLYFGRKACPPAAPLSPELGQFVSMKQALDTYAPAEELKPLVGRTQPRYYWEPHSASGLEETYRGPRYDQPISRRRWQFASREEAVFLEGETEHVPE